MARTVTAVLAWTEDGVEALPGARVDLGERPKTRDVKIPRAAVWANKARPDDVESARRYAATEGYRVFLYPATERNPLGRARREIMSRATEPG